MLRLFFSFKIEILFNPYVIQSHADLLTKAKPKIANYPFTTINPNLGVTYYDGKEITLADIPGLVEGAHKGIGLGDKFLRHIERCKMLLHLIDLSEEDLINSYKKIKLELSAYDKNLGKKKAPKWGLLNFKL